MVDLVWVDKHARCRHEQHSQNNDAEEQGLAPMPSLDDGQQVVGRWSQHG